MIFKKITEPQYRSLLCNVIVKGLKQKTAMLWELTYTHLAQAFAVVDCTVEKYHW